jgi:hypothetical protein
VWVPFPTWVRNFKLFRASFEHSGELREVEFTYGLTSLTCISESEAKSSNQIALENQLTGPRQHALEDLTEFC